METRNIEKYKVFHVNTEHYKNSPILTMQRMLYKTQWKATIITFVITVCLWNCNIPSQIKSLSRSLSLTLVSCVANEKAMLFQLLGIFFVFIWRKMSRHITWFLLSHLIIAMKGKQNKKAPQTVLSWPRWAMKIYGHKQKMFSLA